MNKKIKVMALLVAMIFCATISGQNVSGYADYVTSNNDEHLVTLATELHPGIYLDEGQLKSYGNAPAKVVYVEDTASISLLYEANEQYSEVELITIYITASANETVKIDLGQLTYFNSLKYVLFVYQYNACGNMGTDCLKDKTSEKVTLPAENAVKVLYHLSIPV